MSQSRRTQNIAGQFRCPCCGEWKFPYDFYRNKRTLDGISTYCKECQKAKQKYYSPAAKQARFEAREREAQEALEQQLLDLLNSPLTGPPTSD